MKEAESEQSQAIIWEPGVRDRWAFVFPALLFLAALGVFPFFYSIVVSFQNISLLSQSSGFSGLLNYEKMLLDSRMWESLAHTALITSIALPIETALGLLIALFFQRALYFRQAFIALLILPTVIAPIVAGATWRLLLSDRFGPINQILSAIAGEPVNILWTIKPEWVYPTILLAEIWQWTPFMFLLSLAALATVDQTLIDAAEVDGASKWRVFWRVVLPSIKPILAIAILIRGLDLIRLFDIVWALTRGGPGSLTETISIYVYLQGFNVFAISYTGALTVLMIIVFTAILVPSVKKLGLAK